jgi:hypothetical protein
MDWRGGLVAREAKELAISACLFQHPVPPGAQILYPAILARAVRAPDPFVDLCGNWLIRRLAPDCSRIELESLPEERDEAKLLQAMGWETANIHLGDPRAATAIRDDLKQRGGKKWLAKAAHAMVDTVLEDWKQWKA